MLELKGSCESAKIFARNVEHSALEQIRNVVSHPAFEGETIRIMPDVHAGAGCVIGFTSTFGDKIIPNIVGVDIGCGVAGWKLPAGTVEFEELQDFIRHHIPYGAHARERVVDNFERLAGRVAERLAEGFSGWAGKRPTGRRPDSHGARRARPHAVEIARLRRIADFIEQTCLSTGQAPDYVFRSIGTLGGGNHFIEVDRDNTGALWLTVHSGSRNFGLKVANFHQHRAQEKHGKTGGLEYLEGEATRKYLEDMETAQSYARLNRHVMGHQILSRFFGLSDREIDTIAKIESVHNYISTADSIIRKGAISAHEGEPVIIPWNMRDGLVVGEGKGNRDWNSSAPHGAGRRMSRSEARKKLSLDQFEKAMAGVWSRTVNRATIDEAPFAYKNHEEIERAIEPTVAIRLVLKPVYNFKDDSGGPRRARPRSGGSREAGPRSGGPREAGPRSGGPRGASRRSGGSREAGPRSGGSREAGPRSGGSREAEPRSGGSREAGPRSGGSRGASRRSGGPREAEPRSGGPREAEPRSGGPRGASRRSGGPREAGPRQFGKRAKGTGKRNRRHKKKKRKQH